MLIIYRLIINLVGFFAPIILKIRVIKKKEHKIRYKEKLCIINKIRPKGKLIWFHASSVGELNSIIPLIEKIEKLKKIKNILITTNTLSSSRILLKKKFKKTIHQFLPIDVDSLAKKFLNHWKPNLAIFVESEIWPNFIFNIKNSNTSLILLNGRFTHKTFKNWKKIPNTAKKIFNNFNTCFVQNNDSKKFLNYFNIKNIKDYGNLKYSAPKLISNSNKNYLTKLFVKRKIWCASSTHYNEEEICAKIHLKLKNKIKNLITIIIPRHIDRTEELTKKFNQTKLKVQLHSKTKKIKPATDIYLVNTFGETHNFYDLSSVVFMGKSFNKHDGKSGQNPIEAAMYGCKILHGPNIINFKEIYKYLNNFGLTKRITNQKYLYKFLLKNLESKIHKNKNQKMLQKKGREIFNKTYKEIEKHF